MLATNLYASRIQSGMTMNSSITIFDGAIPTAKFFAENYDTTFKPSMSRGPLCLLQNVTFIQATANSITYNYANNLESAPFMPFKSGIASFLVLFGATLSVANLNSYSSSTISSFGFFIAPVSDRMGNGFGKLFDLNISSAQTNQPFADISYSLKDI